MSLDWASIAERLEQPEAREAARSALSLVELSEAFLQKLRAFADSWPQRNALAVLLDALARANANESPFFWERISRRRTWHLLVVRWDTSVTIGFGETFGSVVPESAWPELAPWKRPLERNAEALLQWAKTPSDDRVVLERRVETKRAPEGQRDEDGLLRAIAAAPDDDTPRLVFADWLTERGDPRGDFLRDHLRLARQPDDEILRSQLAKTLSASWKTFAGPLAKWVSGPAAFERGLVTRLTLPLATFEKEGERLLTEWPIEHISFALEDFTPQHLERLVNAPAMPLVRSLSLFRKSPAAQHRMPMARLATGTRFQRLERLVLGACGHSASDWEFLFSNLVAPKLTRVDLNWNATHPALHTALAKAKGLPQFSTLVEHVGGVLGHPVRRDWLAAFTALGKRTTFTGLGLEAGEPIGEDAILALFSRSATARLERLDLGLPLTDRLLEGLVSSMSAASLRHLSMRGAHQGNHAMKLALTKLPQLTSLQLRGSWRDDIAVLYGWLQHLPPTHPLQWVGLPLEAPRVRQVGRLPVRERSIF